MTHTRNAHAPSPAPRRVNVLHQDARAGIIKVRVDTLDDLWHLHQIVRKGDVVTGLGYREPHEATSKKEDAGKVEKKPMQLGVRVEGSEFQAFTTRLRILGTIVEGPQDHGMHHTINVEEGSDITIRKVRWPTHDLERVKDAVDAAKRPLVTVLAIEENEAVVAVLRQYGVQKVADIIGHESGKQYATKGSKEARQAFFEELMLALRTNRAESSPLLIVGPGFTGEEFLKYVTHKEPALVKGALLEATGQAGMTGVQEALKRGAVGRIAKENRLQEETQLVEQFLEAIGRNEAATYGEGYVREALTIGAAEHILVTDDAMREGPGEALLELARNTGAKATVISSAHEAGDKLAALGGVGAILRYKLGS